MTEEHLTTSDTHPVVRIGEAYLAQQGLQPQVDWVAKGDLEAIEKRAKWTEANRQLFK